MAPAVTTPIRNPNLGGFLDDVRTALGETAVQTDPDVVAGHTVDWTRRFVGMSPAVIRPRDTAGVAEVVRSANRHGVDLVPQGGNTGLVGGSVPLRGEVVLSLTRLDHLGEPDPTSMQITCGAGVTLGSLQAAVRPLGLEFGVDLAARDSCTLGGMAATNAGGIHLVRHGPMRNQVVGMEAVLGDGSVVSHLGGLEKDNTGYDLAALLTGSEGTLGVLTALRLRLHPVPTHRVVALVGCPGVAEAVELASHVRLHLNSVNAIEAVFGPAMGLVEDHLGRAAPIRAGGGWLLVEAAAVGRDPTDDLARVLETGPGWATDVAVATDDPSAARLWEFREKLTEAIAAAGIPLKFDVSVPLPRLAGFVAEVTSRLGSEYPGAEVYVFGHLGDANVHVNVIRPESVGSPGRDSGGDPAPSGNLIRPVSVESPGPGVERGPEELVLTLAATFGGSISAEHGIGTAKKRYLHLVRSPEEIAAFGRLKAALDPNGTLNPNVLLP